MLNCKNVVINGRRTSMRLDRETWQSLIEICEREHITKNELCERIFNAKGDKGLACATRLFVLIYYRYLLNKYEELSFKCSADFHPLLILKKSVQ